MIKIRFFNLSFVQKILLLVMIIEANFFYILPLPNIVWLGNNANNKSYILILLYTALLYLVISKDFKIIHDQYFGFVTYYLVLQIAVSIILIIRSKILYSQSWFSMTQCADYLMMPITSIVFLIAFRNEKNYNKMMYYLFWVVFLCQIVIFLQGVIYHLTGINFCKSMRSTGELIMRGFMIRSARHALNFIGIGYALNNLINRKYKFISKYTLMIMLFISGINLLLFNGYRTLIMATVIMMATIVFLSKNIGRSLKCVLLVSALIILFGFGVFGKFVDSFSTEGDLAGSTLTRIGAYRFAWARFKADPIFGFGMIRPYTERTWLLFGGINHYAVTDAGIVGLLSETGLLGLLTYLVLLLRGAYIIKKLKGNYNAPLLSGILLYTLASCPSLIITNISRCLAIPVCMAIFESVYYKHREKI